MAGSPDDACNIESNKEEKVKDNNKKREEEKEMAPTSSNAMHRSSSRPQLDVSGAAIQGNFEERNPTILLPNQSDDISHLALDIGGSLIKLVYFSRHEEQSSNDKRKRSIKQRFGIPNGNRRSYPILGGRLHFVKFETGKLNECLDFISSKQLHRGGIDSPSWRSGSRPDEDIVIKATGGGAYKFADVFRERLGVSLDKEDEMDCLVAGANFLLKDPIIIITARLFPSKWLQHDSNLRKFRKQYLSFKDILPTGYQRFIIRFQFVAKVPMSEGGMP